MDARTSLLKQFQNGAFALLTPNEIAYRLRLGRREMLAIRSHLVALVRSGELLEDKRGRFGTAKQFHAVEGTVCGNERGFAFFSPIGGGRNLFIPASSLAGALHGDTVLCYHRENTEDEGEVLAIISRGLTEAVGTYRREGRAGWIEVDDRRYCARVFIPAGLHGGAGDGDKVHAAITSYRDGPTGKVLSVLGRSGDLATEEEALIRSHSLRTQFPEEVLKEAARQEQRTPSPASREDLRSELIITVDGEDTRDIDDAISVTKDGGVYHLGVHIADVSHYVSAGGALDREAYLRGTSVYFPDRVLPMLPPALSNGICSLNEGVDRLTLSCFMTVDRKGNVIKSRVAQTIIRSRHRMTYGEIKKLYERDMETADKFPDLVPFVNTAMALTRILKEARQRRGGVNLMSEEPQITVLGGRIDVSKRTDDLAREMIEQFMVLANECVARYLEEKNLPAVFRVHERPSAEKAEGFADFLADLGLAADFDPEKVAPADYSRVLARLEGSPLLPVVSRVMLRSMMKAVYSTANIGHFGLASDCYCHFTSPIRRYPDLTVHRAVKAALAAENTISMEKTRDAAVQSTRCEREAQEAERDVDALYIAEWMRGKVGEIFPAVLSGVTGFALFAELGCGVEGMIPLETLPVGSYDYDDRAQLLSGGGRCYRIGDEVRVKVVGADLGSRRVQFQLL